MAVLVTAIHVFRATKQVVDGRNMFGHDAEGLSLQYPLRLAIVKESKQTAVEQGRASEGDEILHPGMTAFERAQLLLVRPCLRYCSTRDRNACCCSAVHVRKPSPDFMPSLPSATSFSR
jgi:hypothetical protein